MIDRVINEVYKVDHLGVVFNHNLRWFIARQHKFFYAKKSWINPTKSEKATDQLFFQYSLN